MGQVIRNPLGPYEKTRFFASSEKTRFQTLSARESIGHVEKRGRTLSAKGNSHTKNEFSN